MFTQGVFVVPEQRLGNTDLCNVYHPSSLKCTMFPPMLSIYKPSFHRDGSKPRDSTSKQIHVIKTAWILGNIS